MNELKVMMAYILLHYDIKFDGEQRKPDNASRWHSVIPAKATVMFRKRQDVVA